MKNLKILLLTMACIVFPGTLFASTNTDGNEPTKEIKLICSPALEELAQEIAASYNMENEGVKLSIQSQEGESVTSLLKYPGSIAFLTKDNLKGIDYSNFRVSAVGREVFVPVTNPDNPYLSKIIESGISPEDFALAYCSGSGASWDDLLGNGMDEKLKAYRIGDDSFENYLAAFLNKEGNEINGTILPNCEEVMKAVSGDKYSIGFCTLSQLQQMDRTQSAQVIPIPVDMDDNDRIDKFEANYGSIDELARGIWIGKYPDALYSRIYLVYNARLADTDENAFIRWVVSDGQQLFARHGFSGLLENESQGILASLESQPTITDVQEESRSSNVFIVVISLLLAGAIIVYLVLRVFNTSYSINNKDSIRFSPDAFNHNPDAVPGGYFFDKTHTWAYMEKNGQISVGIDDFLQYVTGRITKVVLKQTGEKVKKGDPIFSLIQNGKTLEIKSPLTGVIRAQNEAIKKDATLLNSSPYGEGWLYLIEPADWRTETKAFLMREKYMPWIKEEFSRLKDFIMITLKPLAGKEVVLQDGGELKGPLLEQFGPEAWEEFQTGFLKNK